VADTPAHYAGDACCTDGASVRRGLGLPAAYRRVPRSRTHPATLFRDSQLPTGLDHRKPFAQLDFDGPQLPDDLLSRVPFPCHAPSFRQPEILTPDLTWFKGGRSISLISANRYPSIEVFLTDGTNRNRELVKADWYW